MALPRNAIVPMNIPRINSLQRIILVVILCQLSSLCVFAQSAYRVTIRQVFPKSQQVYYNTFNFKREMDNDISSQTAKLRGNTNNYSIQIVTPSGKETRYIQNINWIQTVNDVKTYHKSQTKPAASYPVPTVWEGTACSIDGSPKGELIKYQFIYKVSKGDANSYLTDFLTKDEASSLAHRLYDENLVEDKPVQYFVYANKNGVFELVEEFSNKQIYQEFLAARLLRLEEAEAERLRDSLATSVSGFKSRMAELLIARDSLEVNGLRQCRIALETACETIPDSLFIKEKLDSTYRLAVSQFYQTASFFKKNRRTKQLHERIIDQNTESRDSLLLYTKQLEDLLLPSNKK